MKKTLKRLLFMAGGLLVLLFALLLAAMAMRERHLAALRPPTPDQLAAWGRRAAYDPAIQGLREEDRARAQKISRETSAPHADGASSAPEVPHEVTVSVQPDDATNQTSATAQLPRRLERCVSEEERDARFKRPTRMARFEAAAFYGLESLLSLVSEKQAAEWAWERGSELMSLGEWDDARRCYWECLCQPPDPYLHPTACTQLVWLEADPEVAAQLLDLAWQESAPWKLIDVIDLCRATGSNALTDHYLTRLREVAPQVAKHYDKEAAAESNPPNRD